MCIDAIEHTYKDPNVTCYVFVTADSDMIPVISRMTYKGKRVELFYLSDSAPRHIDMTSFANYSEDLLTFLNVNIRTFTLDDYVIPALNTVSLWYKQYEKTEFFLGKGYLRTLISDKLSIPPNSASDLIEKLLVEKLIADSIKELRTGDKKPSLNLTESGRQLLIATSEAAPTGQIMEKDFN